MGLKWRGDHLLTSGCVFPADILREAYGVFVAQVNSEGPVPLDCSQEVTVDDDRWERRYEDVEEFFEDYRKADSARFRATSLSDRREELDISVDDTRSYVSVAAPHRSQIDAVFEVFDRHAPESVDIPWMVFIGHGGSRDWRDLDDHIRSLHACETKSYEIGGRAGHGIRDLLKFRRGYENTCAFLVITGEDIERSNGADLRLNLVHEAGIFQCRIGFGNTTILLDQGVQGLSHMHGIAQLRFPAGNIAESFDEVSAALMRRPSPGMVTTTQGTMIRLSRR